MIPDTNTNGWASKGLAGTALGFGIGGAALSLLNGNGCGGGLFGNLFGNHGCNGGMVSALQAQVSKLEAEKYADRNTIDLFRYQDGKNEETTRKIAVLETQLAYTNNILGQITKVVIPNTAVCPGWGNVTVTPATTTTTTTAAAA
jgi:hypothetical protein